MDQSVTTFIRSRSVPSAARNTCAGRSARWVVVCS